MSEPSTTITKKKKKKQKPKNNMQFKESHRMLEKKNQNIAITFHAKISTTPRNVAINEPSYLRW